VDDHSVQRNRDPQARRGGQECVGQEERKAKTRSDWRDVKKLLGIILLVGVVVLLIWRFSRPGDAFSNHIT